MFKLQEQPIKIIRRLYAKDKQKAKEFAKIVAEEPLKYWCPNLVQERMIKEFVEVQKESPVSTTLFTCGNGVGKCLKLDAPVLMANGSWKELGDIVVGDMVIGHNYDTGKAEPTRVVAVTRAGKKKVYRMNFTDGGFVEASDEHHFPIRIRSGRTGRGTHVRKQTIEWIRNRKVKRAGGKVRFQSPKSITFLEQANELPIHPYLLGVILGDGGISGDSINITSKDEVIINRLRELIDIGYSLKHKDRITYVLKMDKYKKNGQKYILALKQMKLMGTKSHNKFIPDIYKYASVEDREQLIAGMIDTDGCQKEYVTKSKQLASDFMEVVKSIGGRAILHKKIINSKSTHFEDKLYYRVYWKFERELPLSLAYKQAISKGQREYSNRVLKDIEYVGIHECGDIQVEHEHHTFISYDYVSTGNTTAVVNIVCNLIYGKQNGWFDYPIFEHFPYPKLITLVTTPGNITDNYFSTATGAPSFPNFLWNRDVTYDKAGKNYISKVRFNGTDWNMKIMTYNQAKSEMESFTAGVFVFDEPMPIHLWEAVPARARKGACLLMPMTPLECEPFIQDDIIEKAEAKVPGYRHITASAVDVLDDKERGHYSKAVFEAQVEKYSKEEYSARVEGKLMYFSERIYDTLDKDVHFVKPEDYPLKPEYLYFHVVDPGDGKPNAEIWGALTPNGRRIVFYEAPIQQDKDFWDMKGGLTVRDHIQQCLFLEEGFERRFGFKMHFNRIIDYHFANQTRGGLKTTLWDDYAREAKKLGVRFVFNPSYQAAGTGENELTFGHQRVRQALQYLPDGSPGLVVWNTCYHTWRGLLHYVRKRAKTEAEMLKPATSRTIIQKYKDFPDVVRYFTCSNIRPSKKRKKENRRNSTSGVFSTL